MDQPGRAQLRLRARLTVPPADAYGVATFYAMLATDPRPPRVIHVCEDLACKCVGSDDLIAQLEERFGPEGDLSDDGSATWYRSPCLGQCDRAPAALVTVAAEAPEEHVLAPTTARDVLASLAGEDVPRRPGHDAAADRRLAAAALARRPHRPGQPRRLPRRRRLRDAARGDRARPGRRHPRGQGLEADGPRRRRVPDRRQVGGRRPPAGPPALPDLQRRRVRARHVQGPRRDRGRPVLADRGDDHRRLRDRLRARLRLPARRVSAGAPHPRAGPRRGAASRLPRRRRARRGLRVRHRDPQGRRRLHLRRGDGDLQLDRGLPRRAAQQAPVPRRRRPVREADRDQQRRDARERARRAGLRRPGLRGHRHRGVDRHEAVLRLRQRQRPGRLRGAVRHHAGRAARAGRRHARGPVAADRAAGRRRGRVRRARRARPAADHGGGARGEDHARLRRRAGDGRHGRPAADADADRGVLPQRVVRPVRAVPRRHRPPAGGAGADRRRPRAAATRSS